MSDLASRIGGFTGRRILVIGDLMLDRYVYGTVDRISPEAPIPVLHKQREVATLGGSGNVARNLATLGGKVEFVGVIGQDQAGEDIQKEFKAIPEITAHLVVEPARPTTVKTRFVAGTQQLLRTDSEDVRAIPQEIEDQIIELLPQLIKNVDGIILSDYMKGTLTQKVISETIRRGRAAGKQVVVDPKGRNYIRYKGANWLTPNRKELGDATGHAIVGMIEAEEAARTLIEECEVEAVLAKMGGDGVCLVQKDAPAIRLHAKSLQVFDVSGAGDTVIATLTLALAAGFSPVEAAEVADVAGSIVVGKVGTAFVSGKEIICQMMRKEERAATAKMVESEAVFKLSEKWHQQGLKIGFTNGCFDLLHPGHISLLRQARSVCDKLIVGLNSDASIKRLKGEGRPVQNEVARGSVLASLSDVDQVVIFGEDTPLELIKKIRPDVLIKGADYTMDQVVGAKEVQAWGGSVILAALIPGQGTTETIARIKI